MADGSRPPARTSTRAAVRGVVSTTAAAGRPMCPPGAVSVAAAVIALTAAATFYPRCWTATGAGQLRQVSSSVTVPDDGTVAVRLPPLSHVTLPEPSFLTYLYSNAVPAGIETEPVHTG